MTGDGICYRRRRMTAIGAAGGCHTGENLPAATLPVPAVIPANSWEKESMSFGVDFFAQARKAMSVCSPFDADDVVVAILPSQFASLVLKRSDSRKKHKKSHSESKASRKCSIERKSSGLWIESEEYFRELTLMDIEKLYKLSTTSLDSLASCSLSGSVIGNEKIDMEVAEVEKVETMVRKDDPGRALKEDVIRKDGQLNDVEKQRTESLPLNGLGGTGQQLHSGSSAEWVLCSRNKILLTSTRPTKKRKLLGENVGLQLLILAHPCEGNATLCHFCSMGDKGDQLNRLVVCHACNMSVHEKCYGIQGDVDTSWSCSWCTWRVRHEATHLNGISNEHHRSCVLCPKSGGALKPLRKAGDGSGSRVEFAHLFCTQWIPEVKIDDMRMMEPILNIDKIHKTRWKLVCIVCRIKHGTCIRCANGACRTSFHPVCAREAGLRLEIWGRFGCDDVEMRAFCAKHIDMYIASGSIPHGEPNVSDQFAPQSPQEPFLVNRRDEVNNKNGNRIGVRIQISDTHFRKLEDGGPQETGLQDFLSSANHNLEHGITGESTNVGTSAGSTTEDASTPVSINLASILKKLIDRGKVTLKEVASGIGISPGSLAAAVVVNHLVPELSSKVANWLQDHAYVASSHKKSIFKLKSSISLKTEIGVRNAPNAVSGKASDTLVVLGKSVLPGRRMVGNIRIIAGDHITTAVKDAARNNVISADVFKGEQVDESREAPISCGRIKGDPRRTEDLLVEPSSLSDVARPLECCDPHCGVTEDYNPSRPYGSSEFVRREAPAASSLSKVGDYDTNVCSASGSITYIKKRIEELPCSVVRKMSLEINGTGELGTSSMEQLLDAGVSPNYQDHPLCAVLDRDKKANEIRTSNSCLDDEVEGELIYLQHRLLCNVVASKHSSDSLICKIVKSLAEEIDIVRRQLWDDVCLNQCLYELRELKKLGRNERRHEARTVIAAEAAAASYRMSSPREDDEPSHHELTSCLSEIHPRSCDICGRSETLLNTVLICSGCKVAVHLDCYRNVKQYTNPWYCELCEELSSTRALFVNPWEKPYSLAGCGLCGTTSGAFRKSTNGLWVHAFCAEWVFDSTFSRGQVNPIEGMEMVMMGGDECSVCHRRFGVNIKCNHVDCLDTFHPSCGKRAHYFMFVSNVGGKLQRRGYCEKHSADQRAKAGCQKNGLEDLKSIKQMRVELERLRLLCERIVKREKLKRELVICSHGVLASKRDSVAFSMLVRSPFVPLGRSSESATTSISGHGDVSRSGSNGAQKPDDVIVDSRLSVKRHVRISFLPDGNRNTDNRSTSQRLPTPKPTDGSTFAVRQIPYREADHDIFGSGEIELMSKKPTETFEKELVMTSDQASMKNQQLPAGYLYVPLDCLSNQKSY